MTSSRRGSRPWPLVVVCGHRAFIICFTHPETQGFPEKNGKLPYAARRNSLQAAELEVHDGKLTCDRDKPFRIARSGLGRLAYGWGGRVWRRARN